MKKFLYSFWETIEVALIAIIAVFVIRTFLIQTFLVSGASMEPNFSSGDYLLIDELTYHFKEPERGDVVVFHYPGNETTFYIKRIIGLPGERLSFKDGKVMIFNADHPDGFYLGEVYLPQDLQTAGSEVVLREETYFVMGDNRSFSFDSRSWGPLLKSKIVGVVRLRLWPFNKVLAVERPTY